MACPQCTVNPKSHSFVQIGETADGVRLWYTGAGRAEELVDTPTKFGYFKTHLDQARSSPWVWIFDCAGMTTRHQSSVGFMRSLVGALSAEHATLLQGILILHPSIWMRAAIALLSPFLSTVITRNIRYFDKPDSTFLHHIRTVKLTSMPWRIETTTRV
jgi:hypothetical protein